MDRSSPSDSLLMQAPSQPDPMLQKDSVSGQVTAKHKGLAGRVAATESGPRRQGQGEQAQSLACAPQSTAKLLPHRGNAESWRGEVVGKYTLHSRIAAGGMASVYLGSLAGAADFSRVVAIKRMHAQFVGDATFVARFRDEAWLSARLVHPNIVQTFDVVERDGELLLIMEYVDGVSLKALLSDTAAAGGLLPLNVVAGILVPVLHGLHAAHEATDDDGHPLGIVHRDFSPQNIIIGRDGHAKILDFGIAKAKTHIHVTAVGEFTGKFGYLAPEQIRGHDVDRRTDLFAAGIVLWESLTGQRLFREPGMVEAAIVEQVLSKVISPPSGQIPTIPSSIDSIVMRALMREPALRFDTARDMALALESAMTMASPSAVSDYLQTLCAPRLARLARTLASVRRRSHFTQTPRQPSAIDGQSTVVAALSADSIPPKRAIRRRFGIAVGAAAGIIIGTIAAVLLWQRIHRAPIMDTVVESKSNMPAASSALASACGAEATPPIALSAVSPLNSGSPLESQDATDARLVNVASSNIQDAGPTSKGLSGIPRRGLAASKGSMTGAAPAIPSRCDPPTYLDSAGIRHFKNGCL